MLKILIMGLPGSGKTTFANNLKGYLKCVHFNADEIRDNIFKDLSFSIEDRIENAKRHAVLANIVNRSNITSITDMVCPLIEMRKIFNPDVLIYMNTIESGRYNDTNKIFYPPIESEAPFFFEFNHFIDFESLEFIDFIEKIRSLND